MVSVDLTDNIKFTLKHHEGEDLVDAIYKLVEAEARRAVTDYRDVVLDTLVTETKKAVSTALMQAYNAAPQPEPAEVPEW